MSEVWAQRGLRRWRWSTSYGADAIRWFMLSDSPPERDVDWSESGVEGCWRFVNRVWRLVEEGKERNRLSVLGASIDRTP